MTVKELIEKLKKMPKDHGVEIEVDKTYTSYIRNIYVSVYDKNKGKNIVIIAV